MRRVFVAALVLAVIAGLCVAVWDFVVSDIVEAIGDGVERGWIGIGPLLYLVPVGVLWIVALIALYLIGQWQGRR